MKIEPTDERHTYLFTKEEGEEALFQEMIIRKPQLTLIQRTAQGDPKSVTIQFQP